MSDHWILMRTEKKIYTILNTSPATAQDAKIPQNRIHSIGKSFFYFESLPLDGNHVVHVGIFLS